eukprot:TRINITY_DN17110_c0_g1_i1.p1 TRINITY_DN17110_c0_g1~~TRINITY_DN17110_c0_g1_i1.p1  ORF type:complete len:490 (-),score=147.55 TRINITY_DN17110_c0_g1_i1:35-1480(-)
MEDEVTLSPGGVGDGGQVQEATWYARIVPRMTREELLVLVIFLVLGTGVLLPWNAFLTAYDFFDHFYPDFPFEVVLPLAYNYPNVVTVIASIWIGPKIPFIVRLVGFFFLDMVVLVLVPIVTQFMDEDISLWINLIMAGLTGVCSAMLFGTITALGALIPGSNITAAMVGNGIGGLLVAGLRIVTKATLVNNKNSYEISGMLYFALAGVSILLCIVASVVLMRLPITKLALSQYQRSVGKVTEEVKTLLDGQEAPPPEPAAVTAPPTSFVRGLWELFHALWIDGLCVFSAFFVTLSLFPGIITLIESDNEDLGDWFQVILITIFMVGDFIGRSLPYAYKANRIVLNSLTYGRVVFFVYFIVGALGYIPYDWLTYLVDFAFAITNGYCGTVSLMYGPEKVPTNMKEMAGLAMAFFLNLGIFLASNCEMLIYYLITGYVIPPAVSSSGSLLNFTSSSSASSSSSSSSLFANVTQSSSSSSASV